MQTTTRTVLDACQSWLATCERNKLERSTLKAYRSHVNIHIGPKIGSVSLEDLSRSLVRDFLDALLDDGTSHAQTKKIMVSLRSILSEAQDREWIDRNVSIDVKVKRKTRTHTEERIIPSKEELRLIVDNAPDSHRAMFNVAIFTGMRISEMRGLSWEAIDFGVGVIRVRQRADEFNETGPPKSRAGVRDIPMTPLVRNTLKEWRSSSVETRLNLVFPNSVGKVQNYSNIYNRVFKPMLVENGIVDGNGKARFGIHALRHAAASLFIEQGWNPKKIQTLLGHASITMTMDVYGHLFATPDEDAALFEKLESDLLAA